MNIIGATAAFAVLLSAAQMTSFMPGQIGAAAHRDLRGGPGLLQRVNISAIWMTAAT
jgi:hypothetical protein